jgi:hypothetical protein
MLRLCQQVFNKGIVVAVVEGMMVEKNRNGYFGHPENLLLGMITDDRKHIRELGLRRILKARSEHTAKIAVRVF